MTDSPKTTAEASNYVHPFNEGQHDREAGKSEYDNPYTNEQWERSAWQHGWDKMDEWMEAADA